MSTGIGASEERTQDHSLEAEASFYPGFGPAEGGWKRFDTDILAYHGSRYEGIETAALEALSFHAFTEIAFKLPTSHLEAWAGILADPQTGDAEKYVVATLLANAAVAAEGIYPLCQDTGTALVYGWLGERLLDPGRASQGNGTAESQHDHRPTGNAGLHAALSRGVARAYRENMLRSSQKAAQSMLEEKVSPDNLPAGMDIRLVPGSGFRLCFVAKGGGSANRTTFGMESPAILERSRLRSILGTKIGALGASGCPPYHLAAVLGGSSPSQALYALELAALGLLDGLPFSGKAEGYPHRDAEWEAQMMELAAATGVGAQFGGRHLAISARAIRLPRHAASLPLAVGVSCSAHRALRVYASEEGTFVEAMDEDPARFLPASMPVLPGAVEIDLDRPPREVADTLERLGAGSFVLLSGTVLLARDAAHARFRGMIERGEELPAYLQRHPIFYAGPTEAKAGRESGSFGPTTAGRMDSFLDALMERGCSLVTIAKGGRNAEARKAITRHRGAYLACIGGAAAIAARDHVRESRIIDFPELGMEAIRLVRLEALPAMIVVDGQGREFHGL